MGASSSSQRRDRPLECGEPRDTDRHATSANVGEVVIDLTAIDFIDSRGLRLLKRISTAVAGRNATFAVVAPPDSIARSVLDMTRMSDELAVRDSLQSPAGQNSSGEKAV